MLLAVSLVLSIYNIIGFIMFDRTLVGAKDNAVMMAAFIFMVFAFLGAALGVIGVIWSLTHG